jgi:hypothetical protein
MAEDSSTDTTDAGLGRLAGTWRGTNGFRMMPTDEFDEGLVSATVTTAAGGNVVVVTYTWIHPEDGPQDGVLLVGSPAEQDQTVNAAWGDSWHQRPSILTLAGTSTGGRIEVTADYGGGWAWTIAVEGEDPLRLTMFNVVPAEHATADVAAGPYPVMRAELHREG